MPDCSAASADFEKCSFGDSLLKKHIFDFKTTLYVADAATSFAIVPTPFGCWCLHAAQPSVRI